MSEQPDDTKKETPANSPKPVYVPDKVVNPNDRVKLEEDYKPITEAIQKWHENPKK